MNWLCQTHPLLVVLPHWKFGLLKTVGPVENNGTDFVSKTTLDKIGTLVVETLYFFMTYMAERDQVEEGEI